MNRFDHLTNRSFHESNDIEEKDEYGMTLFMIAAYETQFEMCKFLADKGANVHAVDEFDRNSLFHAVDSFARDMKFTGRGRKPDGLRMVQCLLELNVELHAGWEKQIEDLKEKAKKSIDHITSSLYDENKQMEKDARQRLEDLEKIESLLQQKANK